MQSIIGMETVKNQSALLSNGMDAEVTNYRITENHFTLLNNGSDAIYYRYGKGKKSISSSEQTMEYRSYQLPDYQNLFHSSE
jgi:hypothetical protein